MRVALVGDVAMFLVFVFWHPLIASSEGHWVYRIIGMAMCTVLLGLIGYTASKDGGNPA